MNQSLSDVPNPAEDLVACLKSAAMGEGRWRPARHEKGRQLIMPGERANDVLVLDEGLVKLSYYTPEGAEWIKSFIADRGVFGAADNDLAPASSTFLATCLEPCTVVALPLTWASNRLANDPALQKRYGRFLVWLQMRKQAREESLLCQSAADRYVAFAQTKPDLMTRLSQADIARYIGVTPIAFSRIKRRLVAS